MVLQHRHVSPPQWNKPKARPARATMRLKIGKRESQKCTFNRKRRCSHPVHSARGPRSFLRACPRAVRWRATGPRSAAPLLKRIFTIAAIAFLNFTILKRFGRCSEDLMASRREQMQERIESPEWAESEPENVFRFHHGSLVAERRGSPANRDDGSAALQLVHQLADAVRSREDHAAEVEARAHALGKRAIDELHLAEDRLRATDAA